MRLVQHARRRQPRDCDSRQPGDDPANVVTGAPANCCTSVAYILHQLNGTRFSDPGGMQG